MVTITIPGRPAGNKVIAGVQFTDGRAQVARLGTNTRAFFKARGYTVRDRNPRQPKTEETEET